VLCFTAAENANLQIIGGIFGLFVQVVMIKPMLDYVGERPTGTHFLGFHPQI